MCGIAGIVALTPTAETPSREALVRMATALQHRGPDEFGAYRDRRAGFVHARLSIVDLSTGQQPLCNEDGSVWVVFNGEIFNFIELREELEVLGHRFRTRSDTEVIVHAWEAWGAECFRRFNGQWAVALWDEPQQTLVLSRDPVGIAPLHFTEANGCVYFASEIKALFAAESGLRREFDGYGLVQVFTFWSAVPPDTVFQGVLELEPGCTRLYRRGQVSQHAHFEYEFPRDDGRFSGTIEEATEAVRNVLEAATALRITRADVPVGSYLSGGLDSSLIAALGRSHAGARFATFSLRFEEAEYDETHFQRLVSSRLGTDHREVVVCRQDIAETFPEVIWHTERPILRTAPVPMYLLSRLVRQSGIKVVLTGEGADEMFAGYDVFREGKVRRHWARQPNSTARPRLLERLYPYLARSPVNQTAMARQFFGKNLELSELPGFAHDTRWRTTSAVQRLFAKEQRALAAERNVVAELLAKLPPAFTGWTPLAQDQYLENRTLLAGYLLSSQGDRMLLGNSVEGRFPFLDREVVRLANALPDAFKLRVLDEKHVLKRLGKLNVPGEILRRKKQPYRAPDALAFLTPDAPEWIEECLTPGSLKAAGVFEPQAVVALWKKLKGRGEQGQFSNTDNMALVGVLSVQLLYRCLIASPSIPSVEVTVGTWVDRLTGGFAPR